MTVNSFRYLGRVPLSEYDNWPVVVSNLRKALRKWARMKRVLISEGAYARTSGQIYFVVVQLVLLYSSEMLVMNPCIGRVLGGFCHMIAFRLTERKDWRGRDIL